MSNILLVYRSTQLENLLLDANGMLKISDFGLSALPQQVQVSISCVLWIGLYLVNRKISKFESVSVWRRCKDFECIFRKTDYFTLPVEQLIMWRQRYVVHDIVRFSFDAPIYIFSLLKVMRCDSLCAHGRLFAFWWLQPRDIIQKGEHPVYGSWMLCKTPCYIIQYLHIYTVLLKICPYCCRFAKLILHVQLGFLQMQGN